ncbi:MAG: ROK family protein [Candidatus Scatovivens sp.]
MRIGIDLGGSHIGVGLISEDKILLSKEKNFNREDRENFKDTIIKCTNNMISEILKERNIDIKDIELIGIASPGTISNGIIEKAENLKLENFNLCEILKQKYNIPIIIRNDAKAAGLAEKKYGAMKNFDDCIFLSIGTGIGGAAFINGKLLEPKRFSGFEFGHMILNKDGRLCSCGKKGCFEAYASIRALKMQVTKDLDIDSDITGQYLRENLLIIDNPVIKDDIEMFLEYLKTGICNLIDIFEPEAVCLGGSFAYYEGNPILDKLIDKINNPSSTFNHNSKPKIVLAEYKNNAGIIGATIKDME